MNSPGPTIFIDDREQRSGLAVALERLAPGWPVIVKRLLIGDIVVGDRYVIERKCCEDFVASMHDGRLDSQLYQLLNIPQKAMLLVEGEFDTASLGGTPHEAIRRKLLEINLRHNLPVLTSRDVAESAAWLLTLARMDEPERKLQRKTEHNFKPTPPSPAPARPALTPRPRVKASTPAMVPIAALSQIPELGITRARRLLEHFGSMQAIMRADEMGLTEVDGIGPELAHRVYEALHR